MGKIGEMDVIVCGRGVEAPPTYQLTAQAEAAIQVAEALMNLRKASEALHDRDEPNTRVATDPPSMEQQRVFLAHDSLDAAVAAYVSVR